MTSTLAVSQPPPGQDISQTLTTTIQATPELSNQPGIAVSIAGSGGDVALKGQSVVQAGNRQALAVAATKSQQSGGLLGFLSHGVGDLFHKVAQYANDGLSTVQQEYRYLHDVEARHGRGAAIEEGLGILAGGAIGTILDPGEGTVLGAEAAARLEGALTYKDSWTAAANPNYRDPHTGQLVSFGRDVASLVGEKGNRAISGGLDAVFDLGLDPLANVGKGIAAMHSVEGMNGAMGHIFTGLSNRDPEKIDRAYSNIMEVRRAFSQIAGMDSAEIARRYPLYRNVANTLAEAKTKEDVLDVFHDWAKSGQLLYTNRLPTLSLTRTVTGKLHDVAGNMAPAGEGPLSRLPGPLGRPGQLASKIFSPRTWADRLQAMPGTTFDPKDMDFSGKQFDPGTLDGINDINAMFRFGNSVRVSDALTNAFAHASLDQRLVIYRNGVIDTLMHMAKMQVPGEADYLKMLEEGDIQGAIERGAKRESVLTELGKGDVVKAINQRLENHLGVANIDGAQPNREYGFDGRKSIEGPVLPNGAKVQAAITSNQTGNLSIPNLVEARRMAEAIRSTRVHRVLAKADDALYDHITQGFFKPLVLLSGGYGFHISLAEFIPNALRHGVLRTSKTFYNRALATMGYSGDQVQEDGARGLAGWLYHMGGKGLIQNSQEAQWGAEYYVLNGGNKSTAGMSAGDNLLGEIDPARAAENTLHTVVNAVPGRATKEYGLYGNTHEQFPVFWRQWLQRNADDPWTRAAAKAYRDAGDLNDAERTEVARRAALEKLQSDKRITNYQRNLGKRESAPAGYSNADDHAAAIVENLKGSVHAQPAGRDEPLGPVNEDLLASVANGRTPTLAELRAIDPIDRPLATPGRLLSPPGGGLVNSIANFGFRKILDPMVNMISRHQEFMAEFIPARRQLQIQVENGIKSEDEAAVEAAGIATIHSMRFIHNLNDRTQWTATMRNFAPFYFAQEQAYRRMGRLLAEDPGAFRRYQLMIAGTQSYIQKMQDGNGNQYIAFPGSGFVGKGLADLMGLHGITLGGISPASFGGSFSSANVIFPLSQGVRPDLGPVAVVPLSGLNTMFQELGHTYAGFRPVANIASSDLNTVVGTYALSQGIVDQLIPNAFVAHLVQAFSDDRAFQSSVMQAYQLADYVQAQAEDTWIRNGRKGPEPHLIPLQTDSAAEKQAFALKFKSWARALYIGRAISALFSPVSSNVTIQNFGFPQQLSNEISAAGSVNLGMQNFLLKHPDAVPYTVAQSYTPSDVNQQESSGFSLGSSQPAMDWVNQNASLLRNYGTAAYWLMPQLTNEKYSNTVYNEQITQGVRIKDTPDEFMNALYTAAGDNLYYAGLSIHESALASAGRSTAAKNAEYDSWNTYVTQLQQQYPVWAESFFSNVRQTNTQQVIKNLTTMLNKGDAPAGEQTSQVSWLLDQYYAAAADYSAAAHKADWSSAQTRVNDNWIQFLDSTESSTPQLKPIIQTIFKGAIRTVT